MTHPDRFLAGKRGLVVGIANEQSIAAGCAQAFRGAGAELAVTYLNEKARPFVEPVATAVEASILAPLDVTELGAARLRAALDRLLPEGGPARAGDRLLAGRFCAGDGRLGPLLHPPGAAGWPSR